MKLTPYSFFVTASCLILSLFPHFVDNPKLGALLISLLPRNGNRELEKKEMWCISQSISPPLLSNLSIGCPTTTAIRVTMASSAFYLPTVTEHRPIRLLRLHVKSSLRKYHSSPRTRTSLLLRLYCILLLKMKLLWLLTGRWMLARS